MTNIKLLALAATASVAAIATSAQAQFAWAPAQTNGAGASSIVTVHGQVLNCIQQNDVGVGLTSNGFQTIPNAAFDWTASPSADNPDFNCATQFVQPNFAGRYVSTGSGTGRTWWTSFTNQLPGTAANNHNPHVEVNGEPAWTNLQYAFSDTPVSFGDLTSYTAGAGAAGAGKAIQLPFFILPVAFAYDNVYGVKTTAGGDVNLEFTYGNNRARFSPTGELLGGLRFSRDVYCKIFNGEITNWNHASIQALNGNTSLRSANDTAARWSSEGAPIRLVGRVERSGTTDIFNRHLAEVCDSFVATNKFEKAAESLPFNPGVSGFDAAGNDLGPIDMNVVAAGSGTRYSPTPSGGQANFGNNTTTAGYNSISGAYFDRTLNAIIETEGAEKPGLFMLANGSTSVEAAVKFPADKVSTVDPTIKLNGKLGYIGSDFVRPAAGKTLLSAAVQQFPSTSTYWMPDANASQRGFLNILPPEQVAANGRWNPEADTRTTTDSTGAVVPLQRAEPKHWTDALFVTPGSNVANPAAGYPVVGTTQFLTYTCFSSVPKRTALTGLMAAYMSRLQKTATNAPLSSLTFTGTASYAQGTIAQNGIAPMPAPWQNAYYITFLQNSQQRGDGAFSSQRLGDLNLWLIDKLPTRANQVDGIGANEILSNPGCTAGVGA